MTDLRSALEKYLSMRKGLGYKYEHQTRRLGDFVAFMEQREARTITTKLAMEWATLPPDRHASWALRLTDVRGFARHVSNLDPRTEVPPVGFLPGLKRARPHIYSDAQIDESGGDLRGGDRQAICRTLTEGGVLTADRDLLRHAARAMLTGVLSCRENRSQSGVPARIAGEAIGASSRLPNMATEEFLSCLSRGALETAARAESVNIAPRVVHTRERMVARFGDGTFVWPGALFRLTPEELAFGELDAPFIGEFLIDLETKRGASATTRNLRLTAIRSFFRFVSFEEPAHSALIQRVLAIPSKRHDKRQVHFLTRPEIEAILAAPDRTTWLGRRDHTLLLVAVQTGLRLSELISLDRDAVHLGAGAHVRCVGKGRKERTTPLTTFARRALQAWLKEPVRKGGTALFPNMHGGRLSADSVQSLLAKHVRVAGERCPSLKSKRVSPHVLRHSAAMELLQAGVACSVIALWLGHESIETTQTYLHAHLALKEAALAKLKPYQRGNRTRFRPNDRLLAFLDAL